MTDRTYGASLVACLLLFLSLDKCFDLPPACCRCSREPPVATMLGMLLSLSSALLLFLLRRTHTNKTAATSRKALPTTAHIKMGLSIHWRLGIEPPSKPTPRTPAMTGWLCDNDTSCMIKSPPATSVSSMSSSFFTSFSCSFHSVLLLSSPKASKIIESSIFASGRAPLLASKYASPLSSKVIREDCSARETDISFAPERL
mmetsp:Transcript_7602/g.22308  ORF Transcript_7602/g.22308 Transcript_7602/m.22308 type:complete len:201 (+) Transcript_7602:1345-1947(+)